MPAVILATPLAATIRRIMRPAPDTVRACHRTWATRLARMRWALLASVALATAVGVAVATGAPARGFYSTPFEKQPAIGTLADLGRLLFMDPSLSASGVTSCSSCHDPTRAFGPPDGASVQRAGVTRVVAGVRAVPSLTYTQTVPAFTEHFFEDDGDDSEDQGPAGGRTWDGRAATVHDQARLPLQSPLEMANGTDAEVVSRVGSAAYAGQFRAAFGDRFFETPATAINGILLALEVFEQSPAEFYPYSSKYDAWLHGSASLSAEEERGRKIFNDPMRGNCDRCHPSGVRFGALPQFTDYGYVALGLPRNAAIPANADPGYFDLGLCGPLRQDLAAHAAYCGLFRTPSLRNVALRRVFYHNGLVTSLRDAVRFYAERDTHPERWYPRAANGAILKFNDLPASDHRNVEMDVPFGQTAATAGSLSETDIDDLVSFLGTLTDGFRTPEAAASPPSPAASGSPARP